MGYFIPKIGFFVDQQGINNSYYIQAHQVRLAFTA